MPKLAIDDLEIERLLGAGNMSQVFEARIRSTGERVALKLVDRAQMEKLGKRLEVLMEKHCLISLNPASYRDAETVRAFPEAGGAPAAGAPAHHGSEHVCKLFHTFTTATDVALVLELCEGQELWDAVKNIGVSSDAKLCEYWRQIESALAAMHARGIIHRDVKAENIVLKKTGHLKFADFGSAYDVALPVETTVAGTQTRASRFDQSGRKATLHFYVGTPNFMGPERRQNKPVDDARIDVWSLGCLLYQLVTGAPPFQAPSEFLVYVRAQMHDLDLFCYIRPAYRQYIEQCLKDAVEERPNLQQLEQSSFAHGAICCAHVSPTLGDTTATQKLLRRRVHFYAGLISDHVYNKHPEIRPADSEEAQGAEAQGAEAQGAEAHGAEAHGAEAHGAEAQGAAARGAAARGAEARGAEARGSAGSVVEPLSAVDCGWLQALYPWLEPPVSSWVSGEACRRCHLLIDAYALTPGTDLWREWWARLGRALEGEQAAAAEVAGVERIREARCSADLVGVIRLDDDASLSVLALDGLVRCAVHALRELSTRDRTDDLYETWANGWAPPS